MSTFTGNIKKFFRILWKTFKVIYFITVLIFLAVIGYAVYLLHPLYTELTPTIPEESYDTDKITFTFYRYAENLDIYQKLTIYRNGFNEIEITRKMGDFDIDMLGAIMPWHPRRDKETGIITYKRKNIISKKRVANLFKSSLYCGVMDITDEEHTRGRTLKIEREIGLETPKTVKGPDFVGSPIAYPPEKWINRIYWQKLTNLINRDKQLKPFMVKTKYTKAQSNP